MPNQYTFPSLEERFWSKVNKLPEPKDVPIGAPKWKYFPCWLWTGFTHKGYGKFRCSGVQTHRAHRISYMLARGEISSGLELDHLCKEKSCVQPEHLDPIDHAEHMRRTGGPNRGKTHCKRGHAFDEGNTYVYPDGHRECMTCRKEIHDNGNKYKKGRVA